MRFLLRVIVFSCCLLFALLAWQGFEFVNKKPSLAGAERIYEVKTGTPLVSIANDLANLGVVVDAQRFLLYVRILGQTKAIKSGEYRFTTSLYPSEVLNILVSGKSIEHVFTVPEGSHKYEIARFFESAGLGRKEDFLRLVNDPKFAEELLGERMSSLEGYLFPDTYHVTRSFGAKALIKKMVNNFLEVWESLKEPKKSSRHNTVILASIIEKETGVDEERTMVSSVFHNRLKRQMKLQTDPTVLYALMELRKREVTNISRSDLAQASPYNTYYNYGLPVGPISNPGRASLYAALNPKPSKYLYFVSRNDGTHVFSDTYEEHLRAVNHFQKRREAREGKSWRDYRKSRSGVKH